MTRSAILRISDELWCKYSIPFKSFMQMMYIKFVEMQSEWHELPSVHPQMRLNIINYKTMDVSYRTENHHLTMPCHSHLHNYNISLNLPMVVQKTWNVYILTHSVCVAAYLITRQVLTHLPPPPPWTNGRGFIDGIFRCIFVNETFCILNKKKFREWSVLYFE